MGRYFSSTRSASRLYVSVSGYHDLIPWFGVAYDLFGNGKTALKASAGRYLAAATADGIYLSGRTAGNFCGLPRIGPGPTRTPITRWIGTC